MKFPKLDKTYLVFENHSFQVNLIMRYTSALMLILFFVLAIMTLMGSMYCISLLWPDRPTEGIAYYVYYILLFILMMLVPVLLLSFISRLFWRVGVMTITEDALLFDDKVFCSFDDIEMKRFISTPVGEGSLNYHLNIKSQHHYFSYLIELSHYDSNKNQLFIYELDKLIDQKRKNNADNQSKLDSTL